MYETFHIYRASDTRLIGSVSAETREQAVYRLLGGEFGRSDYYALNTGDLAKAARMARERAAAMKSFDAEFGL